MDYGQEASLNCFVFRRGGVRTSSCGYKGSVIKVPEGSKTESILPNHVQDAREKHENGIAALKEH